MLDTPVKRALIVLVSVGVIAAFMLSSSPQTTQQPPPPGKTLLVIVPLDVKEIIKKEEDGTLSLNFPPGYTYPWCFSSRPNSDAGLYANDGTQLAGPGQYYDVKTEGQARYRIRGTEWELNQGPCPRIPPTKPR